MSRLRRLLRRLRGADTQALLARIEALERRVDQAEEASRKAAQHATSAGATAEAAIDGVTGLEDRLAALMENLGGQ